MRLALRGALLALVVWPAALTAQHSEQYRTRGGVRYYSQADTGAVARAESALAADPRNPERYIALGVAQSAIRRYREAIETFGRGLRLAPDNALLYRWRGHRHLTLRQFDRALQNLAHGNGRDSTIYGIWYHLGVTHFVRGEFEGAARSFARAQTMAPEPGEFAGSTDWLWMSLMRAGRAAEAQAVLDRVPDTLRINNAYTQRLKLYRGTVRPEEIITPADTGDIAVATLSFGIGNWYLVRGDTATARTWFQRSVDSGGWPAFGFIASEAELRRLR